MNLPVHNYNSTLQPFGYVDRSITDDEKLITLFLRKLKNKNTVRSYSKAIQIFISFASKGLREVTPEDLMDFLDSLSGKEGTTKCNRISAISSLFGFGVKLGYLRFNPFTVIDKPEISRNKAIDKFFTKAEVNMMWGDLKKKKRNAVIGSIFITAGVRVSELCNIKRGHFFRDYEGNIGVHIIDGKGNKDRDIKIREDVRYYISEYINSLGCEFKVPCPESEKDTYLLLTWTNKRVNENHIRWIIDNSSKKVGIEKKVSPHWFRHTSASLSLANGCDVAKVTENFGWSSLAVAKRYSHNVDKLNNTSVDYVDIIL
jgi:integrase/recombinase XerD